MNTKGSIGFSEEQTDLLAVAEGFCQERSSIESARKLLDDQKGFSEEVWREMVDLGWLAIAVPEEYGGVGLGLAEVVPVVEQMGRRFLTAPFLSTTLAAQAVLLAGSEEQKELFLPELAAGKIGTLALSEKNGDWDLSNIDASAKKVGDELELFGTKTLVQDAAVADYFIVSLVLEGSPRLLVLSSKDIPEDSLRREIVIDETRRSYQLCLDGIEVPVAALMDGYLTEKSIKDIELSACLLVSSEMCGATKATIDYTVEYLKTRKQFGKLIGSYQALKHPIVDAHVAYEQARSHLYSAAHNFTKQGEREIATRMAKAQAGEAFGFAADRAIQFHGGFGFTYECDAQLYRRRAIFCESMFGDAIYHRKKLADLLL